MLLENHVSRGLPLLLISSWHFKFAKLRALLESWGPVLYNWNPLKVHTTLAQCKEIKGLTLLSQFKSFGQFYGNLVQMKWGEIENFFKPNVSLSIPFYLLKYLENKELGLKVFLVFIFTVLQKSLSSRIVVIFFYGELLLKWYSCTSLYMRWPLSNFYMFNQLVDSYRNTISEWALGFRYGNFTLKLGRGKKSLASRGPMALGRQSFLPVG